VARTYEPDPYQADYERQKAAGFPSQAKAGGLPDRGRQSNLLAAWGRLGIGTFCGGLVAVIAAIIIHDHAAFPNSLCNTGLGELGQAFSNRVQTDCGIAGVAESTVGWLVFLGVAGIIIGLAKMGLGLAGGLPAPVQAPGAKRPGAASAQAAAGTAATPAATQAPYGSAPTPPTGPAVPERPAAWAPPPPPPGLAQPTWPEA
jgi:hypothetical protein